MTRREFSPKVRAEIILRAVNAQGRVVCESCSLVLGRKPYHIDHTVPDALSIDKSAPLTAKDGRLLGVECCHAPKTVDDVGRIAKAKRQESGHYGIRRTGNPMPGSRASRWKRKMSGEVVRREDRT